MFAKAADPDAEVFYDENYNGKWNTGEVTLSDVIEVFGCVATRELTIWRCTPHVEVDSMCSEGPGQFFWRMIYCAAMSPTRM